MEEIHQCYGGDSPFFSKAVSALCRGAVCHGSYLITSMFNFVTAVPFFIINLVTTMRERERIVSTLLMDVLFVHVPTEADGEAYSIANSSFACRTLVVGQF